MLSRSDLEKMNWCLEEDQVREKDGFTVAAVLALGEVDAEPGGALMAASPRLALACQSAVALAELIGRGWQPPVGEPSVTSVDLAEAAWALDQEARQALALAGCAVEAGDE